MARMIVPETATELNEMLLDENRMGDLFRDPQNFKTFMQNYSDKVLTKDPDILNQSKEQFENFMISWLKDKNVAQDVARNLNLNPTSRARVPKNTLYNKDAMGAKYDGHFENIADLCRSISDHEFKTAELSGKLEHLKNDASSLKPSDGGFLIPEVLRAEVLQVALETAIVRSRARVIPMDSLTVPFPTVDSTSNVSSVHGGIIGYWTEEGATLTESKPKFGRVKLEAHKLTLYTEVPNELIADSKPAYTSFMAEMFPEAIAFFEDVAFFLGGGVGEPLGFLNAPAKIEITRGGANTVTYADVVGVYSRMLPQSLQRAVWVISPEVLPQLLTMTISGGTSPVWIGGGGFPSIEGAPPMSMLGRPLVVSEKARQLGTAGDINFVDFGHYLIGDRQAMTARQSEDFRFNEDVTAIRVIERLDGRPWLASAITPQNGGDTLSPFVTVAA